jgi:hypothetical protein
MAAFPKYAAGTSPPPLHLTSTLLRLARLVAVGLTATRILLILLLTRRPLRLTVRIADLRLLRVARLVLVRVSGIRHGFSPFRQNEPTPHGDDTGTTPPPEHGSTPPDPSA